MPSRLVIAYSLLGLMLAFLLTAALVWWRKRRLEHERLYGRRRRPLARERGDARSLP